MLLLTKPLGVGVITTALKQDRAEAEWVAAAVASMKQLNRQAAAAALKTSARAMTDITGFGLLGHAHEMAHLGQVGFRFYAAQMPWLPGAMASAAAGAFPGGMLRNMDYYRPWVTLAPELSVEMQNLLYTPETSGGLLVALDPVMVSQFQQDCPTAVVIGKVVVGHGEISVH
jgi:selenide,water dikinase